MRRPATSLRRRRCGARARPGTQPGQLTRYFDRAALKAGNRLEGPAIVNQYDSTTVIPPGASAQIDRFGHIVIDTDSSGGPRTLALEAEVEA